MKFFKSSIFAVLGLAVAMTACSDDKDHPDYSPAGASAGAYFSQQAPNEYLVNGSMSAFDVEVYRTKDAGSSFEVTAADTSGLFTFPSTVTFDGTSLSTQYSIAFDASKLAEEVDYEVTLKLAQASSYGKSEYTFVVRKGSPMVVESLGTGDYTYDGLLAGLDPGLPVTRSYMPANPNKQTYVISDWFYGEPFTIEIPDLSDNTDGRVPIFVTPSYTGYTDKDGYQCWATDYYTYIADIFNPLQGSTTVPPNYSYYEPEKGLFTLCLIYYAPEANGGLGVYTQEPVFEYFQLEGYPDYSIEVTYDGLFIKKNGNMEAHATIVYGPDAEEVKAVMVEGKDAQAGIDAIQAGADNVQTFDGVSPVSAAFPVSSGGDYTIVAATYAGGEMQIVSSDSFTIELGDDSADWDALGLGQMMDGWIMAAFSIHGVPVDVTQYPFDVPIQKHKTEADLYRLVQPYGPDYPLAANNSFPAKRNIQFHLTDDIISILPQFCGFGTAKWGAELQIGNYAGYLKENNPDVSYADIKTFLINKGYELDEYAAEDGYAIINIPMFGNAPGIGADDFGYNWQNYQAAYIFMPNASASAKAKIAAKAVAAPAFKSVCESAMRASKAKIDRKVRILSTRKFVSKVK